MKTPITLALMAASLFTAPTAYGTSPVSSQIKAAVASDIRAITDSNRDANRKPDQILNLLGVEPGMKVIDFTSGSGYYSELLSLVVGQSGEVIAHNPPFVMLVCLYDYKCCISMVSVR